MSSTVEASGASSAWELQTGLSRWAKLGSRPPKSPRPFEVRRGCSELMAMYKDHSNLTLNDPDRGWNEGKIS